MYRGLIHLMGLAAIAVILGGPAARTDGAEREVAIKPKEAWGCVFGGRKVEFHFAVEAQRAIEGRAAWGLAVDRGTVARGETAVVAGPQKPGEVTVRLDVPEAREGIVLPAVLSLALESPARAGTPIASLEKRLWIFPENPFAQRTRWLEQLDIRLFDPGQKTQPVLQKMKVPFRETRNVDSLAALDKGLVIIGEGFSELAARHGNLVSVKARLELKATDRRSNKVLVADREVAVVVDLSEQIAGKSALQKAALEIAPRILPKAVEGYNKAKPR